MSKSSIFKILNLSLAIGLTALGLAGCGGGGASRQATPERQATPPDTHAFTFTKPAPRANHLAFDARDEAHPKDSAAVSVCATHAGKKYVLLARRAPWLGGAGTWGTFGGGVDPADKDSTGSLSFARAAEHEFYEETVSVYHSTDANDLRACPTHLKRWKSGARTRTFFSSQPWIPEERFNRGYAYAVQKNLPKAYRENDAFRWVLLEDLLACAAANARTADFRDADGTVHSLELFGGFFKALRSGSYQARLRELP